MRKYFDSVSHTVIKRRLLRIIKCERTLTLLFSIIDSYSSPLSTASEERGALSDDIVAMRANCVLASKAVS